MSTSQDPGSLGVYGFRNRKDYSYHGLSVVNSSSIQQTAIWDVLGAQHKNVVVIGVPPSYPPRKMNGVNVGCFMTPDTKTHDYTYPASVRQEIDRLVGEYPVDVKGFRTDNKEWLRDQIYDMTRKHFEVIRYLMATLEWDYFQFVEIGVDRVHHGFLEIPRYPASPIRSGQSVREFDPRLLRVCRSGNRQSLGTDRGRYPGAGSLRSRRPAPGGRLLCQRMAAPRRTAGSERAGDQAHALLTRLWWTGSARGCGAKAGTMPGYSSMWKAASPRALCRRPSTTI